MRSREQTGWGFAGTRLKKVPEKGDENIALISMDTFTNQTIEKSPRERGRKRESYGYLIDGHAVLLKKSPRESNAIKLSGRTSWLPIGGAPRRGEGGYVAVLHESVGISIASDYST